MAVFRNALASHCAGYNKPTRAWLQTANPRCVCSTHSLLQRRLDRHLTLYWRSLETRTVSVTNAVTQTYRRCSAKRSRSEYNVAYSCCHISFPLFDVGCACFAIWTLSSADVGRSSSITIILTRTFYRFGPPLRARVIRRRISFFFLAINYIGQRGYVFIGVSLFVCTITQTKLLTQFHKIRRKRTGTWSTKGTIRPRFWQ